MKASNIWCLLTAANFVEAQQIYIPTTGSTARPQCSATATLQPSFTFRNFSFSLSETVRTATSVPSPTTTTTYAPPYSQLSSLLSSVSYTTWGSWNPNGTNATDTSAQYGNAAWTALWQHANPPNFTETGLYSTTVSPTPVASSELVLPPRDYFGPTDCYDFPEGFMFGVSSSASQIEGATAQEGKSPSLMDILVQDARPKDYTTNENYYLYKQDIERVAGKSILVFKFIASY